MERKPNKMRAKLAAGGLCVGSAIHSWSPNVMEIGGYAGLDFMRIDNEHAWRQDSSAEHLMRAAAIADIVPMLRVDRDNPFLVRKALEIGAGAVLVPNIYTPEEAEAVVRAAKFPPRGMRGYCGDCFSAHWGTLAGNEWVEWSDREPLIGVMVEHVRTMEAIDEIMSVEGLDYVFFGAADYSMSIGLRGPQRYDKRIMEALRATVKAADKHGVWVGAPTEEDNIGRLLDEGVVFFEILSDLLLLHELWSRHAKKVGEMTRKASPGKK